MQSIVMGEHEAIYAGYLLTSSELTACSTLTPEAEGRLRPPPQEEPLRCPRCNSTNTKFCYYNNYSLSQPRYFCRSCRRYWTKGGSLRNVPVGGGCRRNKRYRPDAAAVSAAATVHHRPQPALLPGDRKPALLTSYLTNNGGLNSMNNCKPGLDDMNTLGLIMDGSRETLMEEPGQNLKFLLDGEGSWNNLLSIGWQESIGYSDDHQGSLSSSWARI